MNDSEMSPIKQHQISSFVMANADRERIPVRWEPRSGGMTARELSRPFSSMGRAINAMGVLLEAAGGSRGDVRQAAAAFSLIGAGIEVAASLRAIWQAFTAAKAAEGTAHLAKWGPAALAVGATAAAGVAAYIIMMDRREFNFEGDYSKPSGQRKMQAQMATEGL